MDGTDTDFGIELTGSYVIDDPSETEVDKRVLPMVEACYSLTLDGTPCIAEVTTYRLEDIFSLGCDKNMGVFLDIFEQEGTGDCCHLGNLLTSYETGDLIDDNYWSVVKELLRQVHKDFYYKFYFGV